MLEREIKLRFDSAAAARAAVIAAGASSIRGRRLQEDYLLDTADDELRRRRSVLRVRTEDGRSLLTFKGPPLQSEDQGSGIGGPVGNVKVREEIETAIGDGALMLSILEELGFHVWFRYQKFREEFALGDVIIAVDETPVGVFVELEGGEQGVANMAAALGRGPTDYLLDSYRALFVRVCEQRGTTPTDMLFDRL